MCHPTKTNLNRTRLKSHDIVTNEAIAYLLASSIEAVVPLNRRVQSLLSIVREL